jgi:flagellar basal-body rod protein FlgB
LACPLLAVAVMEILGSSQRVMEAALQIRSARAEILAGNVANADTPGFAGRDIDFDQTLAERLSDHNQVETPSVSVSSQSLRADGNNVDLNEQLAQSYQNSLSYIATLRLYSDSVGRIRTATSNS